MLRTKYYPPSYKNLWLYQLIGFIRFGFWPKIDTDCCIVLVLLYIWEYNFRFIGFLEYFNKIFIRCACKYTSIVIHSLCLHRIIIIYYLKGGGECIKY